ncbi:hypothetical protein [Capnocytophaga haemolytica]
MKTITFFLLLFWAGLLCAQTSVHTKAVLPLFQTDKVNWAVPVEGIS